MEELKKALELKKELDSLRPIDAEMEAIIMQKFRLDWNYHSNHLEGNTLTYGETKALLLFNITAQGKPLKDHIEVTGHNEAINWVIDVVKGEYPLTENFIRQIHSLLLKEPYEVDAETPDGKPTKKKVHVGEYKKTSNHVKTVTGEIFRFATSEETPAKMTDLLSWYNNKIAEETVNPILLAAEFHYKFIRIHPFDDGNGRTARIIMNFVLMKYGFPPTIIKTEDKENYFAALRLADTGNIEAFIQYIAQNLIHSLELMIAGAKGETIEEDDDIEKEVALLEQRFKHINNAVTLKSQEEVMKIYDNFIKEFSKKIEERQSNLFKKFYSKFDFRSSFIKDDRKFFRHIKTNELSTNINTIDKYLIYVYFHILNSKVISNTFEFEVIFEFGKEEYKVLWLKSAKAYKCFAKRKYGELLTADEMDFMVNKSVKLHRDSLKNVIEQKENTN
ncbi:MAG: Fic family protein [Bacteroidota bacterium]